MKKIVFVAIAALSLGSVSACQTISEESCLAGSWEDVGFKDGEAGRSRSRLANIAETCAEYGVSPDRQSYIRGLEMGLQRYCGYDNGFNDGRNGQNLNAECEAGGFDTYLVAHADGYEEFLIRQERDTLIDQWKDRRKAYRNVVERLDVDALEAKERRRLERKADRLIDQMDDLRIEIRSMERVYGLTAWRVPEN